MPSTQIYLTEGKEGCQARTAQETIEALKGEYVYWDVTNHCSSTQEVELRGLQPYVTGTRRAPVSGGGGTGQIRGRANTSTMGRRRKYAVYLDGTVSEDPYIVIEDPGVVQPLARVLAIVAGIGIGYFAYRSLESLINTSLSKRELP
jgi:hypothetical protein